MITYIVSKECDKTETEKLQIIDNCSIGDLLKILREYENNSNNFEVSIIKYVKDKLYDLGIMCL